jgi:hypothetical protein
VWNPADDLTWHQRALRRSWSFPAHFVIPLTQNIAKDFVAQYKQFLTKEERKIIIQSARNTSFAKVVFKVNKGCPQHVSNMIGLLESKIDTLSEDAVESISKILEWDSYAEVD